MEVHDMEINSVILHTDPETGMVVITYPTGELSLEETAKKDVPTGTKYWVVDKDELPEDRSFRDAWEIDEDYLGTHSGRGE
jgi:hypothetical protein